MVDKNSYYDELSGEYSTAPEWFSYPRTDPKIPTAQVEPMNKFSGEGSYIQMSQEDFAKLLAFAAAEEQAQTLNPTSVSQAVIDHLVSNGMFESQAAQVLNIVKGRNEAMNGHWEDNKADYPDVMLRVIILDANLAAVEWIDENLPNAFFRPMFANQIPKNS